MKTNMNKLMTLAALVSLSAGTLLWSSQSQGAVALAMCARGSFACMQARPLMILGALFAPIYGAGLIFLDGPTTQGRFVDLSDSEANKVGLDSGELDAFRGELEEINATVDQIRSILAERGLNRVGVLSVERQALQVWKDQMAQNVSPAAVQAVTKVLAQ